MRLERTTGTVPATGWACSSVRTKVRWGGGEVVRWVMTWCVWWRSGVLGDDIGELGGEVWCWVVADGVIVSKIYIDGQLKEINSMTMRRLKPEGTERHF